MPDDNFFVLTFHPASTDGPPTVEQLETEIQKYPGNVQPSSSRPTDRDRWDVAPGAVWYSVCQRKGISGVCLHGPDPNVIKFVLALLKTKEWNACLNANHRPILTQIDGQLRVDLQRFWTPELLQLVREIGQFERARILYDFPEDGFFQEKQPEPCWERHLLQAIVNVFSPERRPEHILEAWDLGERLGFEPADPKFLNEFCRLSDSRLRLGGEAKNHAELREFLHKNAPHMWLKRPTLPTVVIGGPALIATRPAWIHFLSHQHGGYGCLHSKTSGVLLPLQLNRSVATLDPGEVLDGFEAMAEEPDHELLKKHYPVLDRLTHTHGDPYDRRELDLLHKFISKSYRIPRFTFGREALLEFEDCDPLDWFAGWQMALREGEPIIYNKETQRQLKEWYGAELKCYFLWNNSD